MFFPPVLIGDLHGDGRMDLVVGKGREELHIYAGIDAPDAFARVLQTLSIALPDDERDTQLVDVTKTPSKTSSYTTGSLRRIE